MFIDPSRKIEEQLQQVKKLVEEPNSSSIKQRANGGNSILVVCPPEHEHKFIEMLKLKLSKELYEMIDLNRLLIDFINMHKQELLDKFNLLQSEVGQIFKSPPDEDSNDFFTYIINKVNESFGSGKIPFLYSVGALYGARIDNIHLIEHKIIMNSQFPLVILYPATIENGNLIFLCSRAASKYRCIIVE